MKVNRLIIKNSGPLTNLDIQLSPVTLIIGDNERGKTCLINWIVRGIFDKPGSTSTGEIWSDNIGGFESIQIQADSFYSHSKRDILRNLLFIQESDLLFKSKKDDLIINKYWNHQVNSMFYGANTFSNYLQKNFAEAMGVGNTSNDCWLKNIYEKLFVLKNILENFFPDIELLNNHTVHLFELSDFLEEINREEQEIQYKEDLYFIMNKIFLGKKYLEFLVHVNKNEPLDMYISPVNAQEEIVRKEDKLVLLDNEIQNLKKEVDDLQNTEAYVQNNPFHGYRVSFAENILNIFVGIAFLVLALILAYQSMTIVGFSLIKFWAILFFIGGISFILLTWMRGFYVQYLTNLDQGSFLYKHLVGKAKRKFLKKYDQLEYLENQYETIQEDIRSLKRLLQNQKNKCDIIGEEFPDYNHLIENFEATKENVLVLYGTLDANDIASEIKVQESFLNNKRVDFDYKELEKITSRKKMLLQEHTFLSQEYETIRNKIINTVFPILEELKSIGDRTFIEYFYPEVYRLHLEEDLLTFHEFFACIEDLIETISRDRYYAEKLVYINHSVESEHFSMLIKTLHSPFFEYLVQNIFSGRYKGFRAEFDYQNKIRIFAETGNQESFPLESLSFATYTQFWVILRVVIAKDILGKDSGILLLDNPFNSFDVIRKQIFIDFLNALAHEGWQIVYTLTDDETMLNNFKSIFGSALKIIDLNYDSV